MPIRKAIGLLAQEFELDTSTSAIATLGVAPAALRSLPGLGGRSTASTTSSTAGSGKMSVTVLRSPALRPGPESSKKGGKREVLTMPVGMEPLATITDLAGDFHDASGGGGGGASAAVAVSDSTGGGDADDESVVASRQSREAARARARRKYGYDADLGQDAAKSVTISFPTIAR